MKTIFFLLLAFIISFSMRAQEITGQWNGILKVQGIQLRAVFHISKTDTGYSSTMDSPDQGVKGMSVPTFASYVSLAEVLKVSSGESFSSSPV